MQPCFNTTDTLLHHPGTQCSDSNIGTRREGTSTFSPRLGVGPTAVIWNVQPPKSPLWCGEADELRSGSAGMRS